MIRMDQYGYIRTAHRVYKKSIKQICRDGGKCRLRQGAPGEGTPAHGKGAGYHWRTRVSCMTWEASKNKRAT